MFRLAAALAMAPSAMAALDGSRYLWYNSPASRFEESLPIGNGRMGATIYGGGVDQVGLNEDSIWSGPYQYRPVPDGPEARPIANAMLLAGNISEANDYIMRSADHDSCS